MIDPSRITAFDVETKGVAELYGLQPFRAVSGDGWLTTCAVAYWEFGEIITEGLVRPTPEQLAAWLDSVLEADHYVVCWNAPFDVAWLLAVGKANPHLGIREKVYKVRWLDALLLLRHLVNAPKFRPEGQLSLSLKAAVERRWPERAGYEDGIDYDDESPENVALLLEYNRRDSHYTLELACEIIQELSQKQMRTALIQARCIPDVAETYVEGIKINPEAATVLGQKLEEQRRLAYMTLKLKHPEVSEEILASPTKLADLLFVQWGLPVVELTETDQPSTNKATLTELAVFDERAKHVHSYRDAAYCKAKFATGLVGGSKVLKTKGEVPVIGSLEYNGDGMSRPQARIFGTYTSRMTYSSKVGRGVGQMPSGCAIHQWKRDPEYRALIEPPEGYDLVEFDFAGQEFRWMAVEANDPLMLQLCEPGQDAHAFMGARIANVEYEWLRENASAPDGKPKRQLGKVANLSLQYRTSPPTLVRVAAVQHKVKLDLPQATVIHATYLTTYRMVPKYWRRQIQKARQMGYVETLAGTRVNLGHPSTWVYSDGNDAKWSHESTAINAPIQGIGADQKYLGLLCMHDLCSRYGARFYFELHDGMFYVVPKDKSEAFAHAGKKLLSNLPYERAWGVRLPIQFPVDGKLGPSWGQLKEFH